MATAGGGRDFGLRSASNFFTHPSAFDPTTTEYSYAVWWEIDEATSTNAAHGISGDSSFSYGYVQGGFTRTNTDGTQTSGTIGVSDTPWHFFAQTHDAVGEGTTTLYLGIGTDAVVFDSSETTTPGGTPTGDYFIGKYNGGLPWSGDIAHVLYYDRSLSLAELEELQYNPYSIPDSVGHLPLWGVDDPEIDVSGNGLDTTATTGSLGTAATSPPIFLLGGQ